MHRIVFALLLLLAACQPVPRPFSDAASAPAAPALRPPDSAGIIVLPVAGAPDAAAALAKALQEADVPASTAGGNRGSYRLEASETAAGQGLALAWTLRNAKGGTIGSGSTAGASLAAAAQSAAVSIAQAVAGDAPAQAAGVPALVSVKAVSGAPGDGGTSLARAIGAALGSAGVEVGEGKTRFALSCLVAVAPPKDGQQLVSVRWVVALAEGRELGQVNQQNAVPAGSLDGAWGDLAYDVAGAAAPGIARLIDQARTQLNSLSPPGPPGRG
jgi:hypothetical protein